MKQRMLILIVAAGCMLHPLLAAYAQCAFPQKIDYPANQSKCGPMKGDRLPYKMGGTFDMKSTFNKPANTCWYHQQIRGKFEVLLPNAPGGVAMKIPLALAPKGDDGKQLMLEENTFHEDGISGPNARNNANYGHRDQGTMDVNDVYDTPDRPTGTEYKGHDFPGLGYDDNGIDANATITVDLTFEGSILDTSTKKTVEKTTKEWSVKCSGKAQKPPKGDDDEEIGDSDEPQANECVPLLQSLTSTELSDATPVIVALTVCKQTPAYLNAVVSTVDSGSGLPLSADEVGLSIAPISMPPFSLLYGPTGTLMQISNKNEGNPFGIYWFNFSQESYELDVQLSIRGSRTEFTTTLQ